MGATQMAMWQLDWTAWLVLGLCVAALLAPVIVRLTRLRGMFAYLSCMLPVAAAIGVAVALKVDLDGDVLYLLGPDSDVPKAEHMRVLAGGLSFGLNISALLSILMLVVAPIAVVVLGWTGGAHAEDPARRAWVAGAAVLAGSVGAFVLNALVLAATAIWIFSGAASVVLAIGLVGKTPARAWRDALLASYTIVFGAAACWLHGTAWRITVFSSLELIPPAERVASLLAALEMFPRSWPSYAWILGACVAAAGLLLARQRTGHDRALVALASAGTLLVIGSAWIGASRSLGLETLPRFL